MASKTEVAVNLFDPAVQQCPYDAYKTLRDEAPAYNIPGTEIWVVTRYEDVRRVLTDADAFPSTSKNTAFRAGDGTLERAAKVASRFAEKGWVPAPTLNGRDDPNHKQMRAMFNEAFKPSRIKEIDSKVESLAYDLIDAFLPDGHCDWVSQFAVPLPLFIIGEQMGAPREDMWQIKLWTDAFFQRISFMLPEDQHLEMVDREIEAQHHFQPIFERLRKNPDESLISVLVNTVIPEWGRPLNDNELHAEMMADTFVGGSGWAVLSIRSSAGRARVAMSAPLRFEFDVQFGQAAQQEVGADREVVLAFGEPHVLEPVDSRGEAPGQLPPRERRAQAMVRARAKAHVRARLRPIEVDLVGIVERPFIAIGGSEADIDHGTVRNRDPAQLGVARAEPH